jgi:hypothetical protein
MLYSERAQAVAHALVRAAWRLIATAAPRAGQSLWLVKRHILSAVAALLFGIAAIIFGAPAPDGYSWFDAGQGGGFPAQANYDDPSGKLGVIVSGGPVEMKGHPFFEPLGTNGRACVTCHQPSNGMSVSTASLHERWQKMRGKDPVFAAVDGSNCPSLPQDQESSHSLLLNRGLFRVFLPWPPKKLDGTPLQPEFKIEVVRDPTGCNLDPTYGLKSAHPTVSVFRRPRPVANLKYPTVSYGGPFNIKTGTLLDVDPETGRPVSMNLLSDARQPTLKTQAIAAAFDHEQASAHPSNDQLRQIVDFESRIYMAQIFDQRGGELAETGGPPGLGPQAMANGKPGALGDNDYSPVFLLFDAWKNPPGQSAAQREFRASVARGADIYMFRQFWIRDATHINTIGLGNPIKRSCSTCHNAQMTGQDLAPGWVDLGTNNYPTWTELPLWNPSAVLPVFKITCDSSAAPHPFLGRVIYTSDPGRALISGKCADVGSIVMQQLRGLSARAPYFSSGSAKSLREVVDYYDRRFDIKYNDQEKQDLINFLSVL